MKHDYNTTSKNCFTLALKTNLTKTAQRKRYLIQERKFCLFYHSRPSFITSLSYFWSYFHIYWDKT